MIDVTADPEADLISSLRQQLAQARLGLVETQAALRQRDAEHAQALEALRQIDELTDTQPNYWVLQIARVVRAATKAGAR